MTERTTDRDTLPAIQPYSDRELDDAMRELVAIEAAERDRQVLLEVWRQRNTPRRGLASRLAAWLTAAVCLTCSASALAEAPPKPKRPVMCLQGQPVEAKGGFKGFLCTDGKRPRILVRYTVVQFVNEAGDGVTYVLGWPTAAKRAELKPASGTLKL